MRDKMDELISSLVQRKTGSNFLDERQDLLIHGQ